MKHCPVPDLGCVRCGLKNKGGQCSISELIADDHRAVKPQFFQNVGFNMPQIMREITEEEG